MRSYITPLTHYPHITLLTHLDLREAKHMKVKCLAQRLMETMMSQRWETWKTAPSKD